MIRAQAGPLWILGIDAENVRRLKAGKPIALDVPPGTERLLITYGETVTDILRELEEATGAPLPPASPFGSGQA